MTILILAAGYGTRLYSLVKDTPKALLEIHNKSLIDYLLDKLKTFKNLNKIIVVTNNKFYSTFLDWAQGHRQFPCAIEIVNDGTNSPEDRLGSIGDINYVLKNKAINDDLLVLGSDNLFDYSLDHYGAFASTNPNAVTIGLYDIENKEEAKKFGVVSLDSRSKIVSFEEKPAQPKSTLVSMCCYYMPVKTLGWIKDYLDEVKKSDTAGDYIRWLGQKKDVFGFKFDGKWYDIGSVESFKEAQERFKQ